MNPLLGILRFEYKIYSEDQEAEADKMIQPEGFILEYKDRKEREHHQCDDLLDYFQLPQVERSAVALIADPVRRDLENVLKQGNSPAEKDYRRQAPFADPSDLSEFQVPVPCKGHECV